MRPATRIINIIQSADSVPAPAKTVDPSIDDLTPTIPQLLTGSDGTWENATSFSRQWYRDGVAIGSATNATYTTQDADFGKVLTYGVTATGPGGTSAEAVSAATAAVAEVPVQSLGTDCVANGTMEAGNPPTSWAADGTPTTFERSSTQAHGGTYSAHIITDAASEGMTQTLGATPQPAYYEAEAWLYVTSGNARYQGLFGAAFSLIVTDDNAWVATRTILRVDGANPRLYARADGAAAEFYFDDASLKAATINAQLTAPSADMRLDFFYTLPGSPAVGTTVWLLPRISDFAAGNYWLGFLRYTGAQWDINLYSVATHSRTSRIAATNIGTTNGMRVTANGDSWELFTTVNGGSNWTSRGTATNSTYNTATGVNVLHTSDVTAGELRYAPA